MKKGLKLQKQELALRYIYIVRNVAIQMRDVYMSFLPSLTTLLMKA